MVTLNYFRDLNNRLMKFNWIGAFALLMLSAFAVSAQQKITNELIWASGEFSSEFVDGLNSMNDGVHYTSLEESDAFGTKLVKYSYETGKEVAVILTSLDIFGDAKKGIDGYQFSSDEKQVLIQTETEPIYRWSF